VGSVAKESDSEKDGRIHNLRHGDDFEAYALVAMTRTLKMSMEEPTQIFREAWAMVKDTKRVHCYNCV